jgi:hypothetical protein
MARTTLACFYGFIVTNMDSFLKTSVEFINRPDNKEVNHVGAFGKLVNI